MEPNLTALIAVVSCLVGGGIGWGAVRATLGNAVKSIEASATKLQLMATEQAAMKAVQDSMVTAMHAQDVRIRELEISVATIQATLKERE